LKNHIWSSLYVLLTLVCISAIEQVGSKGTDDTIQACRWRCASWIL